MVSWRFHVICWRGSCRLCQMPSDRTAIVPCQSCAARAYSSAALLHRRIPLELNRFPRAGRCRAWWAAGARASARRRAERKDRAPAGISSRRRLCVGVVAAVLSRPGQGNRYQGSDDLCTGHRIDRQCRLCPCAGISQREVSDLVACHLTRAAGQDLADNPKAVSTSKIWLAL
jgi:hypothetical protein